MSKCCQQAANFVPFDGRKEPYMKVCNTTIEAFFPEVRKFVDDLCEPEARQRRLKSGGTSSTGFLGCCLRESETVTAPSSPVILASAPLVPSSSPTAKLMGASKTKQILATTEFESTTKVGEVERSLAALSMHIARASEKMVAAATTEAEKEACSQLIDAVSTLVKSSYAAERQKFNTELLEKTRTNFVSNHDHLMNIPEIPIRHSFVNPPPTSVQAQT